MMSNVLHCGNCGAPVKVPPGIGPYDPFTCPFCGAEVEQGSVNPAGIEHVEHELGLVEQTVGVPSQHPHYVSGEADVQKAPLSDWEPGLEPPANRSSGLAIYVVLMLAAAGLVLAFLLAR